jgi:hypothetical protein
MTLYGILRRNGWKGPAELEGAAARSARVAVEEMLDEVRWIRSYVLEESDGTLGTFCVYEASTPEAIRRHAAGAELPLDDIVRITDTLIVTPDALLPRAHETGAAR